MQDALEYSHVLTQPGAFCAASGRLEVSALTSLRKAEVAALKRKQEHHTRVEQFRGTITERVAGVDPLCLRLGDFADKLHWRVALNMAGATMAGMHSFARWSKGRELGCDRDTPWHPSVAKAVALDETTAGAHRGGDRE